MKPHEGVKIVTVHCPSWRRQSGGTGVQRHSFLTLALDRSKWSTYAPADLPPGKEPRYRLNRRLGDP